MLPLILFLFPLIGVSLGGSTTGKPVARNKVIRASRTPVMGPQVKSPRLLDSGTAPEARSSLVKTKVPAVTVYVDRFCQQQVLVRKGKGPTWASASTYPTYLASQVETGGERKLDQVSRCRTVYAL